MYIINSRLLQTEYLPIFEKPGSVPGRIKDSDQREKHEDYILHAHVPLGAEGFHADAWDQDLLTKRTYFTLINKDDKILSYTFGVLRCRYF